MATLEELQTKTKERMENAVTALRSELANIRTGRATPSTGSGESGLLWDPDTGTPSSQCIHPGT